MRKLRTPSLATLGSNDSDTPTSPLRSRSQNPDSNPGMNKNEHVYVSIRPALNDSTSSDTLVSGEEDLLSPLSLPRSIDSAMLSKIDERLGRQLRADSENQAPKSREDPGTAAATGEQNDAKT